MPFDGQRPLSPPVAEPDDVAGHSWGTQRERFLSDEPVQARPLVLSSWQRSSQWRVNCDALQVPYQEDFNADSVLTRAAADVLDRVESQIVDQPVAVALTDSKGLVLDRRVGQTNLAHYLDQVSLAPGFTYAERFVGTNGIGTALEAGHAAQIFDQEHFTGPLINLTCAGVPIYDPLSGLLEGLLDITCFARHANPLLMTMAVGAAQNIQNALLHQRQGHDIALLNEYLRLTRRCHDPVLAVSDNVLMLNEHAHASLSPQDQNQLVERLRENVSRHRTTPFDIELPNGQHCRVHTKEVDDQEFATIARIRYRHAPRNTSVTLPVSAFSGLAGSSLAWQKCSRDLQQCGQRNEWALLHGEPGTGKSALVQAVDHNQHPRRKMHVVDVQDSTPQSWSNLCKEVADRPSSILLRHLDQLSTDNLEPLQQLLDTASASHNAIWIAATAKTTHLGPASCNEIVAHFPRLIEVPPLRHHIEDLKEIAPLLLQQATKRADSQFTSSALHVLMRRPWPNNIGELRELIASMASKTNAVTISADHLPPECFSHNKRVLTRLESTERDAIIKSLTEADGNRSRAARAVGISRATIYRKINEYGIDIPPR